MRVRVHPATPGDAEDAARLHCESWRATYRGLLPEALIDALTVERRQAQWRDWLARGEDGLFVAEDEGEALAGILRVAPAEGTAAQGAETEIDLLHVRADLQGRGVGAALLRAGARWAARERPGPVGLWVIAGNERAARVYARLGARRGLTRAHALLGHGFNETAWLWDDAADLARRASRVSVRPAAAADLDGIAEIHWRGWEEAYRGQVPDALLDATTLELRRSQWPGWFAARGEAGGLYVAEGDGGLLGYVSAGPAREIAADGAASEIMMLYVRAAGQGGGVGRALTAAAARWAAQAAPGSLGLWVVVGNAPARAFYERLGGRPGRERREIVRGHPIDEIAYLWDDAGELARRAAG
ncbi:MAG: GNAT family N-acetyltransferase [Rhizobiales bacterium]|nr:GNAT family N-acetyltransferase [Hyphomicrobiales bacterium]